jgi:hypothetical protein
MTVPDECFDSLRLLAGGGDLAPVLVTLKSSVSFVCFLP